MRADQLLHLEHGSAIAAEHGAQLVVGDDLSPVGRVLEPMLHILPTTSVRGIGPGPTIAASSTEGIIGFDRPSPGLRVFTIASGMAGWAAVFGIMVSSVVMPRLGRIAPMGNDGTPSAVLPASSAVSRPRPSPYSRSPRRADIGRARVAAGGKPTEEGGVGERSRLDLGQHGNGLAVGVDLEAHAPFCKAMRIADRSVSDTALIPSSLRASRAGL